MRRKICVKQRDSSDCGPACISSVLTHYGTPVPVARIRQLSGTDQLGTSMWGMVRALKSMGFETKGLKGSAEHLDKLPLPFIAHLERPQGSPHYICIYGFGKRNLRVMDPATGRIDRWDLSDFLDRWSGAVIAMVRGIQAPGHQKRNSGISRVADLLQPVWKPLLQALVAGILHTGLGLSMSIYIGKLTDHVFVTHNSGLLNLMSTIMVAIALVMAYLLVVRNLLLLKTGQVIDNQLISSYIRHLFRLPQRFFDTMKTGEIISRINDAVKIRAFVNDAVVGILINIVVVLFSFTTMFILNPTLAFIMAGMIPFYILIYLFFNGQNRRIERKTMEHAASLESHLVEAIQSSSHIRQHNLTPGILEKAEQLLNRLLDTLYRSGLNLITASVGSDLINRLFTILLLWVGSYFVTRQQVTPGNLLSFYALVGYFTGPVTNLIAANRTFQNALIAADRLFEIYQLEPDHSEGRRSFNREHFGDIVFQNVSFAYGCRGFLFRDLSFSIEAGSITALTGASGSGKSTIVSLIQHLYPVSTGRITINGYDTSYFSGESIRSLIGVVPQQIRFLTGPILENIAPGEREPDIRRIMELIAELGLTGLIDTLPGGLAHSLAENGNNLSGGERQRLAMARAVYRQPALLILDEGLSSLDLSSANDLCDYLQKLKEQGISILLVTHRNKYAQLTDRILHLENGRISPAKR